MPDADGYQILSLDDVEPVFAHQQQAKLLTLRRLLGYRAAGVNAWTGDKGERVVPPHEEDSGNEELYVVVRGRAAFTVGDETADAPGGTLVHVPGETHRTATAAEDGTIVLAVGGRPGEDHWHGAAPNRFMTHLAILEVDDDGNFAAWGDHVTDEEYAGASAGNAG